MRIYQVIVPFLGIIGIVFTIRQFRKGINTFFESLLWSLLWLFISMVAIFPDEITFFLSRSIGIKDHINGIIFIGLAISFLLNFKLFDSLKKQNKIITELVRKMALEKKQDRTKEE